MTNKKIFSEIDKVDQRFKGFVKAIDKCETTKELKKLLMTLLFMQITFMILMTLLIIF